jgi:hypothetical protein
VVPADDKKNARLIVSQIIVETLSGLNLHYPPTSKTRRKELQAIRQLLEQDKGGGANRGRRTTLANADASKDFETKP